MPGSSLREVIRSRRVVTAKNPPAQHSLAHARRSGNAGALRTDEVIDRILVVAAQA